MKHFRSFLFSMIIALFLTSPVWAQNAVQPSEAGQKIMNAVDQVLTILKSGKYSSKSSEGALIQELDPIIHDLFDFTELSRRTIGPRWDSFTPEQQKAFTQAFARLLTDTYIGRLQAYSDESVIYLGERSGTKGNIEVQTAVIQKNKQIPLYYHMHKAPDWRVYDVWVEGVSLVRNYRTQFQEILVNQSPDQLIEMIQSKSIAPVKK